MVLTSCSIVDRPDDNEGGYGKEVAVKGTIMARATGTAEEAETDYERINDWWVLFVDNTGKIVKYLDRATATGNKNAVVSENFYLEIPAGTYTAYSFANITRAQVEEVAGSLQEKQVMPDLSLVKFNIANIMKNGHDFVGNSTNIPMTGKQEVTFQKDGAAVVLEVIRMVAKLEFRYRNSSTKDITINSISMQQTNLPSIPLLPNYEYINNGWPVDAADGATEASKYTRNINKTLNASGSEIQFTDKFYMIEEQAKFVPAKRFILTFNITRKDGKPEEVLYALTNELSSFYRNDHVVIPIVFSDYAVDVDVKFYPPIGGYPAVITRNSKEEYFCEFATQGNFTLRPKVVDTSNNYQLVYTNGDPNFSYEIEDINDPQNI